LAEAVQHLLGVHGRGVQLRTRNLDQGMTSVSEIPWFYDVLCIFM
jgi:hypothetical protein